MNVERFADAGNDAAAVAAVDTVHCCQCYSGCHYEHYFCFLSCFSAFDLLWFPALDRECAVTMKYKIDELIGLHR